MLVHDGFELIQSFLVVAVELSFRRSAEQLNLDQSALTRRIQKLEEQLGFALFERDTHNVSLTPAGRIFYERNARLLQGYSSSVDAARSAAEGKTGMLRIAQIDSAATTLVPQAMALFQQKHPNVNIHLHSIRTQDQKLALANDEIDLGYMIGPYNHREFRTIQLKADPLCVVMPSGHPLADKSELAPTDLIGIDVIIRNAITCGTYREQLEEMFNSEGVPLQYRFEASNTTSAVGLVAAGLGVTIFPKSLAGFFTSGVEFRPIIHPDFLVPLILVWRHSNSNKAVLNFVEVAKSI